MALAQLSIDLVAKVAQFEQDLKKATTASEKAAQTMASAFGIAKAGLAGFAGALSIDAVREFVLRTTRGIDALNDLSDATGSSVENLSALEDIAKRTGTSFDTVGGALVKLNKTLGDAKTGSDAAAAFKAIGLSVADLKKEDPAEALRKVALALSGFADDSNKARLVQELFGKSIKEVAPLLNDLAAAGQLNATVTTEQAKEAERFNQQLSAMAKNSEDLSRALVGTLLPGLNKTLQAILNLGKLNFSDVLTESLKGNPFKDAAQGVDFYTEKLAKLQTQRDEADAGSKNGFAPTRRALLQGMDDEIAKAQRLIDFYTALAPKKDAAFRPSQNYGETKPNAPEFKVDPELNKASEEYRKLAAAIGLASEATAEEITNGEKLSSQLQLRNKILETLASGQVKFSDAQKASIIAALDGLVVLDKDLKLRQTQEAVQKQSRSLQEALIGGIERESAARIAGNESLRQQGEEYGKSAAQIEALRLARLEDAATQEELLILAAQNVEGTQAEVAARQLNLDALREQIRLRRQLLAQDTEARTNAGAGAQRAVDAYLLKVSEAGVATEQIVGRAMGNLEDGLTAALSGGKADVRSFVNSVLQEMIRLQVVRPLLASIFGGGGVSGFQSMFSQTGAGSSGFGTGLAYGNQDFGGFFADGGYLGAGKWGIAGEKGPEPIVGPAYVMSNKQAASAPVTQNIFNIQGDASENTVRLIQGALAQYEARQMTRARG